MRICRGSGWLIKFSVETWKLDQKSFKSSKILTCGIVDCESNQSKEVLLVLVDWRCCKHRGKDQSSSPPDVPANDFARLKTKYWRSIFLSYLLWVRISTTKIPEFVFQGCSTSTRSNSTPAISKCQIVVNITVAINDHRLFPRIQIIQN